MSKRIRFVCLITVFVLMIGVLGVGVSATEIAPYALPSISSTTCGHCGATMAYAGEDVDYRSTMILSQNCAATPDAIPGHYHEHIFKDYYNLYWCDCGTWGRMYVKTTMRCEITQNPFNIDNLLME